MTKEQILDYLREIKVNSIFKEIGLFGSYAKDSSDCFSDIDIAIRVDNQYLKTHDVWDYFDAIKSLQRSILEQFHIKSDIFDLDSISPFKEQIIEDIIYV